MLRSKYISDLISIAINKNQKIYNFLESSKNNISLKEILYINEKLNKIIEECEINEE